MQRRGIKPPGHIHAGALGTVLRFVEVLRLFQGQGVYLGIGGQGAAVGVAAIEGGRKFLAGLGAGLGAGQVHLPLQVGFEAGQLRGGQGRVLHHVGEQRGQLGGVLAQAGSRKKGLVGADRNVQAAAHAGHPVGQLRGRHRGGAFLQQPGQQVGQGHFVGRLVHVAGLNGHHHGHFGHLAVGHQADPQAVVEGEFFLGGQGKIARRAARGRGLLGRGSRLSGRGLGVGFYGLFGLGRRLLGAHAGGGNEGGAEQPDD